MTGHLDIPTKNAGEKRKMEQIRAGILVFAMCGALNYSSISNYPPGACPLTAHQTLSKTIYVESWKTGGRDIQEQTIAVELSPSQRNYEAVLSSRSGAIKYLLTIDFELWGLAGSPVERYKVSLSEYTGAPRLGKRLPSYDLLMREQPSSGKDWFPKEDSVAEFYPLEDIPFFKYGFTGYPISAKRVIKVESFYCIIQAAPFKISLERPRTFDSLTLQIEFRNKYEGPR